VRIKARGNPVVVVDQYGNDVKFMRLVRWIGWSTLQNVARQLLSGRKSSYRDFSGIVSERKLRAFLGWLEDRGGVVRKRKAAATLTGEGQKILLNIAHSPAPRDVR
jgi:hypothetical protein